jgi:riboflavin synthase
MFTGIIQHLGIFKGYRRGKQELAMEASTLSPELPRGESVAIDGVCLSLIRNERSTFYFNLSDETLHKTTLGRLRTGHKLNIELPLTLSAFTSGHLVTGHVDSRGRISNLIARTPGKRITVSFPPDLRSYFISKGSVAVNGVSLTIAALEKTSFEVELIPLTLEKSNLGDLRRGDEVNMECDIIGKYVYNWLSQSR